VPNVFKSGILNLLKPSGPVQACNGIALSFSRLYVFMVWRRTDKFPLFYPLFVRLFLEYRTQFCDRCCHQITDSYRLRCRRFKTTGRHRRPGFRVTEDNMQKHYDTLTPYEPEACTGFSFYPYLGTFLIKLNYMC
jgi:hypothetical protein